MKTRVDIERIIRLWEEMAEINKLNLTDIEFYENGKKIEIKEKAVADWKYTGLNNIDFIMSETYRINGLEKENNSNN